jgi:hypothetical protein
MNYDELKQELLKLMPDAIFDMEYGTGEVMISTGIVVGLNGKLERVADVLGES